MLIEMFFFFFFSGRKKTRNEANWSKVNRNGLHSQEESLDLEGNSNMSRNYN